MRSSCGKRAALCCLALFVVFAGCRQDDEGASSGAPMTCCGQHMTLLTANTTDASLEKHVPAVTVEGDTVTVAIGSVPHPMIPEHYIQWVYLQTDLGGQRKCFNPGDEPTAEFKLVNDQPVAAFAYCNKHGLWSSNI